MKKLLYIVTFIFSVVFTVGMISDVSAIGTVQAMSKKSKALKAYAGVLRKKTIKWGNSTTSLDDSTFGLAYVNNDNVPELVVNAAHSFHAAGYYALYTYKNGKVRQISTMMDGFAYYPKKNLVQSIHSGTGGYERYYFIISGLKRKNYLHKVSEKESGWDINGDGKYSVLYSKYISDTDFRSEKISKKQFNKMLKKKVGSTKLKQVKFYENTSKSRKKILGKA